MTQGYYAVYTFNFRRAILILSWALLAYGVVKVAQFEKEYSEYNPYDILKLEPVIYLFSFF